MPEGLIQLLASNWLWVVLALFFAIFVVAAVREREEGESYTETSQRVGEKSKRATGGIVGVLLSAVVGLLYALAEAGMQLGDFLGELGALIGSNPDVVGWLTTTFLGWAGLSGRIPLTADLFVGLSLLVLGALLAYKGAQDAREMGGDLL